MTGHHVLTRIAGRLWIQSGYQLSPGYGIIRRRFFNIIWDPEGPRHRAIALLESLKWRAGHAGFAFSVRMGQSTHPELSLKVGRHQFDIHLLR